MPAAIAGAGDTAVRRFLEFFAATIRNKITRTAYYRAVTDFFAWVAAEGAAGDRAARAARSGVVRGHRGGTKQKTRCPLVGGGRCPDRMVSTYAFAHLGAPVACVLL